MCASQHISENPLSTVVCKYGCEYSNTDALYGTVQCPINQDPQEGREETFMGLSTISQDGTRAAVNQNERALPDLA